MKTIEIKVPELGKAVGTTAWVADKLEHIAKTLTAGKTNQDEPALFYYHWDKKDASGNPCKYVLIYIPCAESMNNDVMYNYINGCKSVFPTFDDYSVGLFPLLTSKANTVVRDFLDNISNDFYDKWQNED